MITDSFINSFLFKVYQKSIVQAAICVTHEGARLPNELADAVY